MRTFSIIATFLLTIGFAPAQTLHFILAADTQNPKKGFAESCRVDSVNMSVEANEMKKATGYSLQLYKACGKDFNAGKLQSTVESMKAGPGDVVILFISCAAVCDAGEPDTTIRYKNRWLCFDAANCNHTLSTDMLLSIIENKKARLNVLIVNACGIEVNIPVFAGNMGDAERSIYRSLLGACGTVRAFSSKCTQYSYGDKNGGLYTNALLDAFKHFISIGDTNLSWKALLDYAAATTSRQAKKLFRNQSPVYYFDASFKDKCGQ